MTRSKGSGRAAGTRPRRGERLIDVGVEAIGSDPFGEAQSRNKLDYSFSLTITFSSALIVQMKEAASQQMAAASK